MKPTVAPNIFYNSQHSPVGSFASFTLGFKGAYGGLGMELAGPARQNVYIGAETETAEQFLALPFYAGHNKNESDSGIPDGGAIGRLKEATIRPFSDDKISRETTPTCDVWRASDLEFKIYSPFLSIPDPQERGLSEDIKSAIIPAVFVELTLDNTAFSRPRKAFFGYEGNDPYVAMRRIDGDDVLNTNIKGIGQGMGTGIFTSDEGVECALAFSVNELLADNITNRLHFGLGTTGLMLLTARAFERRVWKFVVCFYRGGAVTVGMDASYLYTRFFKNIEDVARYGLDKFEFYKQAAIDRDASIFGDALAMKNRLNASRRFMLSMAIKSYYGSTQLLIDNASETPFWIVNEGGYRMINTLDLAVDHIFFEMMMNPWVARSVLERYVSDYSYYDRVKNDLGDIFNGGISFTHDMGVANVFSKRGASSYELRDLNGCYSYMTQEQLVNWILCAGVYYSVTSDGVWLKKQAAIIDSCLTSMINRDGESDDNRDGVMDLDSDKTGNGAEITTYDNVDKALGPARRNSYLAVKCWAAYLALQKLFDAIGLLPQAKIAAAQAAKCADTVLKYQKSSGIIPALLENGDKAMTLSVVDGLVFPYIMGLFDDPKFIKTYGGFVIALKKHFETALNCGCKFDNGGWKMSMTSDNSWLSKTFLYQFISEKIFSMDADVCADKIHASWLLDPTNASMAFSDQMMDGKVCGSAYYPRGVTAILWVWER